jgi:DNA integrity scanning protein DisA with diadenylate cyclase activity
MTRAGQVKVALLVCLAKGVLQRGDRVVCLTGIDGSNVIDTLLVLNLGTEPELFSTLNSVAIGGDVLPEVFERTLTLAAQLGVEGREGRPVGAIFVVGDSDQVLAQSRSLVLNPFRGYPEVERNILDPALEETVKEFSAIDGAFVVRGDGVVLSAGAHLLPTVLAQALPKGLGTRHAAAAAITASTGAVAITISQSTGTVSVFKSGLMVTDIHKPANGSRLAF